MQIVAILAALVFHAIAAPPDVTGPGFTLGGYTVPEGCVFRMDGCPASVSDLPSFSPETDKYRPGVRVSFTPDFSGTCVAAEAETVAGQETTIPAVAGGAQVQKGVLAYVGLVLYDRDERTQMGADPDAPYRIGLRCQSDDGTVTWSTFYEISPASGPSA